MNKNILFLLILFTIISQSIFSQQGYRYTRNHAFSGTLMIGVEGGASVGFTDYKDIRPDIMGKGIMEYFFPTTSAGIFSIRAFISGGYVGGKDVNEIPQIFRTNWNNIGGGVSYTFSLKEVVFPYIFLGSSYLWFDPKDENRVQLPNNVAGIYEKSEVNFHADFGIRFLLTQAINFNVNIGGQLSPNDNWDDMTKNGNNDFMVNLTAGISYSLFTDADSDGDGIADSKDQCPGTPKNVRVDEFGCPLDTDRDGVPDYLDKCPNTKAGIDVDENGCPLDTDKDGVPDHLDKCPGTPLRVKVNENGCPDSDNDGIFDDKDECPGTPARAQVNANGCPKDSDLDGVPDYLDKCPNTPAGQQVDENGCAIEVVVKREAVVLSGDTNFESGKSILLQSAYPVLNQLAKTMSESSETRWMIIGHTDSRGSDELNMRLSRERAQAVADYLISQGIDRRQLEIIPMGESRPVASNDTAEGRAMNRRVEIRVID